MKYVILIAKIVVVFLVCCLIANTYYEVELAERRWKSSLEENPYGFKKENYTCSSYERKIQSNTYESIYRTFKSHFEIELLIVFLIALFQFLLFLSSRIRNSNMLKNVEQSKI